MDKFPTFGYENAKPDTAPVYIGDDCWIGERSGILKGSYIGNGATIGYGTLIIGKKIDSNKTVVSKIELKIF
jgi:acetyltransferase-like isoleucine patch superfamily enzyme